MEHVILVIDDDQNFRAGLDRRLRREGFKVLSAGDGWEGLEVLKSTPADLILVDVKMPKMNGYQFLEMVKSDPDTKAIPVIMVSGLDDIDSIVTCLEKGADDYINKPFNATLLLTRIRSCLDRKILHDREIRNLNELKKEQQHADELLRALFPQPVIQELKEEKGIRPRSHDNVAVLFADVVNFTKFCSEAPPQEVLEHLQELIQAFEKIALKHQLQKIKTIGDAFMCVGGLWGVDDNLVSSAVECGLKMVEFAPTTSAQWQVRVGIHVGPVIAGVVGHLQYMYDVWGDTVNVAARVQQNCAPGTLTISEKARTSLAGKYDTEHIGNIFLKGKGEMNLYTVVPDTLKV